MRHWVHFVSGRSGPGFSPPAIVPNVTRRVSRALIGRPLYGPRKEASFADSPLNALALCLLEGLGVRHEVVDPLSVLAANDP